jgi:hypothetical protein
MACVNATWRIAVLFVVGLLGSSPHLAIASDLSDGVTAMQKAAYLKLDTCALAGKIATGTLDLTRAGPKSARVRSAFDKLEDCRKAKTAEFESLVADIRPKLKPGSKAEDALKAFVVFWKSEMADLPEPNDKRMYRGLVELAQRIIVEAEW